MTQNTTLTIAARDEDDFDDLMSRAQALFNRPPAGFKRAAGTRTLTYQAPVLRSFEGDDETLIVALDFDTMALKLLGVDLSGRDALAAGESAVAH